MQTLPLHFANNHLLVTLDGRDWLLDTGGSVSFGSTPAIRVDQQEFSLSQGFLGLTPAILSEYINAPVAGLLGVDIMNELDVLIDAPEKTIIFSKDPLSCNGSAVPMEEFMGLPIIDAMINGIAWRMFFDSGAQLSYFEDKIIKDYPETGTVEDFYPGLGNFITQTHMVGLSIAQKEYRIRCGSLPELLGMTLMLANVDGIIGNEVFHSGIIGYFPRRCQLVFA